MKLSEFVLTKIVGKNCLDWEYFADVSVTTGLLWWKRTTRRQIHRTWSGSFWMFTDTGKYTPGRQAEELEGSYAAREKFKGAT